MQIGGTCFDIKMAFDTSNLEILIKYIKKYVWRCEIQTFLIIKEIKYKNEIQEFE